MQALFEFYNNTLTWLQTIKAVFNNHCILHSNDVIAFDKTKREFQDHLKNENIVFKYVINENKYTLNPAGYGEYELHLEFILITDRASVLRCIAVDDRRNRVCTVCGFGAWRLETHYFNFALVADSKLFNIYLRTGKFDKKERLNIDGILRAMKSLSDAGMKPHTFSLAADNVKKDDFKKDDMDVEKSS